MADSGLDVTALNLLADVAASDSNATRAWSESWEVMAIQVLNAMRVINKKGLLLLDLGKGLRVPKRKRSKLSDRGRSDLLGFSVPKKKRTNLKKRKRSGDHDDDQFQRPKRQKTIPANDLGSSLQLGHSQEIKSKIGGGDIPLWSFQMKSQFRFSLIKIHQSAARTTMVS